MREEENRGRSCKKVMIWRVQAGQIESGKKVPGIITQNVISTSVCWRTLLKESPTSLQVVVMTAIGTTLGKSLSLKQKNPFKLTMTTPLPLDIQQVFECLPYVSTLSCSSSHFLLQLFLTFWRHGSLRESMKIWYFWIKMPINTYAQNLAWHLFYCIGEFTLNM